MSTPNPTCPTWCQVRHPNEVFDRDGVLVHYQRIAATTDWTVDLSAVTVPHDGEATLVDPRIVFEWRGAGDGVLTRDDALAIADALRQAATSNDPVWALPNDDLRIPA